MAAVAAPSDPWADYNALYTGISVYTNEKLKQLILGLNEACAAGLAKTGRKQEYIERIRRALEAIKHAHDLPRWAKARQVLYQIKLSGTYSPDKMAAPQPPAHASPLKTANYHAMTPGMAPKAPAYANPHLPPPMPPPGLPAPRPTVSFKPSPFLRVDQMVSPVVEGPESNNSSDRRQAILTFSLTDDQQAKLKCPSPKYQLRLYCTSSTYHTPSTYRATAEQAPIEFPPTCEIRVNGTTLTANTKGLKKKAGTAPPADLGRAVKLAGPNRVEMVYINSNANAGGAPVNAGPKKYYIVVMLVEVTTVDQLVDRLKKGKYRDSESVLADMRRQAAEDDDDIVSGAQKMSLRDPITMVRVGTPTRSARCVHPACFDAPTWFMMMESTTTWQCPICDKLLDPDDLLVDGYFESIIRATPDDCDDVMVEADGEWHTGDNKYASANWRSSHPPPAPTPARSPTPAARPAEVFVLDSDGEDEDRVKRELSPGGWGAPSSYAGSLATLPPGSQLPLGTPGARVIDLTGDSDDEEPLPPPTPAPREPHALPHALPRHPALNHPLPPDGRAEKRKAPSDDGGDALWKRPRPADPYAHGYAGAYPGYRAPSPAYERPAPAYGGRPTPTSSNSSQQASNGINYRYPY